VAHTSAKWLPKIWLSGLSARRLTAELLSWITHGITTAGLADEIRMGKALRDGYRQKVFLMTKVDGRTKEAAAKQLDESLKRLQVDHVDLL
jgi:predicted aldo/keto reductase-like oxidoreductase